MGKRAAIRPDREQPIRWFKDMVSHSLAYATQAKREGRKIVGIACEFTPRELIMAAGGVPVCLCGGAASMIPPAERHLPSNLCPLVKSTFGYCVERANPFLEMADLVVVETTCDGKKKMYEWLGRYHPTHVVELPQKPRDPDAFTHWRRELAKLRRRLELECHSKVTDRRLREAMLLMNRERDLRRRLAALFQHSDPPLSGRELLDMKSLISCQPRDLGMYELALEVLPGRRPRPGGAGSVRVLLTGVPMPHGAERVLDIVEQCGGLVVAQENCTGLKPLVENADARAADPLVAIAAKYFHLPCPVMTPNTNRFDLLRKLATGYRPQCVIEVIWQACLAYDVESGFVRTFVENDLGLPYLRIETDYSPSDSGRIETRVQALFEMVRGAAAS